MTIKPVRREHRAIPPRPVLELARYVRPVEVCEAYRRAETVINEAAMEAFRRNQSIMLHALQNGKALRVQYLEHGVEITPLDITTDSAE